MGAESSAARSCRLEEPPFTLPAGLSVYRAVLEEEQPVSVFIYQRGNEEAVNKAAKHLKTLRHPCLLRFLSSTVEVDGIHLVTERVQPLHMILEDLSADEICAGIFDVLQALIFLHDRGKLSHNNVCISSVFVSEDGHWKLGGMESMCQFSQASAEFLSSINSLRDLSSIAPEEQSAGFQILPETHGHARDAYSFGVMVEKLLPLLGDVVAEHLLTSFQEALKVSLLNPDPMQRPSLQSLLTHEFFRNEFLEVVNFLKSLTLKTEEEKNEFFKFLLDRIQGLPEGLMASRLVPQLLTPLVFAEPVAIKSFLPHLLRPKKDYEAKRAFPDSPSDDEFNSLLSPNVFRDHVIPILLKLYSVREEHVRMVLLSHLDTYADLFQLEDLQEIVLPQVLLGLRDTSNSLVSGTLCSLAVLVPLLGADVVVGGERAKIFKRTTPNFRSTEITPEGSPAHVNNSHELYSSLALNNNSFKLFSKISESKKKPTYGKEKKGHTNLAQIQHPSRFQILEKAAQYEAPTSIMSMNGIRGNDISGAGCTQNSVLIHEFAEDWPDWSKSEDNERNVGIKIERTKDCISTGNQSEMKDESWDDFEPNIDDHPCTIKPEQSNKQQTSDLPITGNKAQSKGMKLSLALKTRSVTSCENWRNDNWNQQNISKESQIAVSTGQTFSRQKTTAQKTSLNTGLGEEFTINVKKKPQRDPELDLFADMIPDIKVSSTGLLMPAQRTELNVTAEASNCTEKTLKADGNSPTLALASKFAVDTVEVETEGWEDDLNWEDNSW
ncbi:protein-associating with the carboxyl-terminal domain of ezrin isoform X2 [Chiloscyllium punctatum]|uniref:protein-associating with the carboxyl-terminal domain of ezrin isoform X2 n=1 Tax=Chiloscyllium punctatum TaxID=137246 RepID=UPI003B636E83